MGVKPYKPKTVYKNPGRCNFDGPHHSELASSHSLLVTRHERVHGAHLALDGRCLRERTRAVDHARGASAALQDHAAHCVGELAVPLALVVDEALERLADARVFGELGVGREDEDVGWRVLGLGVVLDVPDARGGVLRGVGSVDVDGELCGG